MKVLLMSYCFDGTDVGESLMAFKWADALKDHVDLTLVAFEREGRVPLQQQIPGVEVVTWPEPRALRRVERFNALLKPAYPLLLRHVKRWLKQQQKAGRHFDVAHQLMPLAARYPSPFQGMGIPYVMGPLGGTLATPDAFSNEVQSQSWYTKLRGLDKLRFKHDPWLKRSYQDASLILGVAPYMAEQLSPIPLKRYQSMLELGIHDLPEKVGAPQHDGLKLLHVGRGVRTKGLRDAVRALAELKDLPDITLTSAGQGPEIALAKAEAETLGVSDRVTFLGHLPHSDVEALYKSSDIFVFPSFREPTGGVLYEAMRWGLPVITVDYGGPAFIVDDTCGFRLGLESPEALSRDIAKAIRTLYHDPDQRAQMGAAAREKLAAEGLWTCKAKQMVDLYHELTQPQAEAS